VRAATDGVRARRRRALGRQLRQGAGPSLGRGRSFTPSAFSRPGEQRQTRRDYRRIVRSVLVQTLLWLFGVPVSPDDARALVTTLITEGTAPAFAAAARIGQALERGVRVVGLEPRQRDAVLATLESPPDGLAELRGALIRDRERRNPSDR
jgi:hypothetical protein